MGFIQKTKDLVNMWDTIFYEWRNRYDPTAGPVSTARFYMDSNFIYSGTNKATALYVVESFPYVMEFSYLKTLRNAMPPGVTLNAITLREGEDIPWDDAAFKSRMQILSEVSKETRSEVRDEFTQSKHVARDVQDARTRETMDYLTIADATVAGATGDDGTQRRMFYMQRTLLIVTGGRNADLMIALKDLEKSLKNKNGFVLTRITGNLTEYIKAISPFTGAMTKREKGLMPPLLVSDEIAARYHTFEQGVVGKGKVYLGTDINTLAHVYKTFKRSGTDAEVVVILGMTGSGKSFDAKALIMQLQGMQNMVGTINDYEGNEYEAFGKLLSKHSKVVTLDFSVGSGYYYDPVPLRATGLAEVDNDLLEVSKEHVRSIFAAIVGPESRSKYAWIDVILENGINAFYLDKGITHNLDTWSKTEGLTLYDVYEYMKLYEPASESNEFKEQKIYLLERFAMYFDKDKKSNNYFTRPITFEEIAEADLVINNFAMRGRTEDNLSPLDSALIPMNAALISYIRSVASYARGKYNYKVWEELQRMSKLESAVTLLKTPLSGGRKLGDINIVISNDPGELLKEDKFNLFGSVNLLKVGRVPNDDVLKLICQRFNMPNMYPELARIASARELTEGDFGAAGDEEYDAVMADPYLKSFLTRIDNGEAVIVKTNLPKWLAMTPLFRTGVKTEE